mmetsp:Transcript_9544/g.21579  ORF Transcript_9544/g.21579 Transcript_9544/m.21579 type:complete len:86 (-) Transcript_9544:974-1231(-)
MGSTLCRCNHRLADRTVSEPAAGIKQQPQRKARTKSRGALRAAQLKQLLSAAGPTGVRGAPSSSHESMRRGGQSAVLRRSDHRPG